MTTNYIKARTAAKSLAVRKEGRRWEMIIATTDGAPPIWVRIPAAVAKDIIAALEADEDAAYDSLVADQPA